MNTLGLHFKLLLDLVFFFLCLSSTTTHPGVIRRFCCHGSRVDWRRKAPHEATGKSCLCHKTAIKKLGGCECLATWKPYSQNKKAQLLWWHGRALAGKGRSNPHVFFWETGEPGDMFFSTKLGQLSSANYKNIGVTVSELQAWTQNEAVPSEACFKSCGSRK